tara:strand:- start:1079 stop:1318 length:240 start_codon:yes stop_codon:yes gene_type:complete
MSLLDMRDNPFLITEDIQQQIYIITAKLGVPPTKVTEYLNLIQVNWLDKNNNSVMWRSNLDSVEIFDGENVVVTYIDDL